MLVSCPACSAKLKVGENVIGKRIACPKCKHPFAIESNATHNPEPAPPQSTSPTFDSPVLNAQLFDSPAIDSHNIDPFADPFAAPIANNNDPFAAPFVDPLAAPAAPIAAPSPKPQKAAAPPSTKQPAAKTSRANSPKLSRELLAVLAGAGVGLLVVLLGVGIWMLSSFGSAGSPQIANNMPAQISQNIPPATSSPAVGNTSANANTSKNDSAQTQALLGLSSKPILTDPPKWIPYAEEAYKKELLPYAFLKKQDGHNEWMLGTQDLSKPLNLESIQSAQVEPGAGLRLLRFEETTTEKLYAPVNPARFPELLVNQCAGEGFNVKRLAAFGMHFYQSRSIPTNQISSHAWSKDGKLLFVAEGDPDITQGERRRILKINTESWKIELILSVKADSLTVTSEGLTVAVDNRTSEYRENEFAQIRSKGETLIFPVGCAGPNTLLINFDLESLQPKAAWCVPSISQIVGTPDSSRVFAVSSGSYVSEIDVQKGEVFRFEEFPFKMKNPVITPDRKWLITQGAPNKLSRFEITDAGFVESQELVGTADWFTASPDGQNVGTYRNSRYEVFGTSDFTPVVTNQQGPRKGMVAIDSATKAIFIAGKNEKDQLTARIIQDSGDRTLSLIDAPQTIIEKYYQASELINQTSAIPDWLKMRNPFAMSVAPGGKGALLLTMDAAFFIAPTQSGKKFASNDGQSQQVDLMEQLLDARQDKARYVLPELVQNPFELSREPTKVGAFLSFKEKSIYSRSTPYVEKETGDIWWVINGGVNNKIPFGNWLIRIKSLDPQAASVLSVAGRLPDSRKAPSILCKTIGDKRCLVMVNNNLLWLLDRETLQPVQLGSAKNPIDLQTPRFTSICGDLNGDQIYQYLVADDSVDRPCVVVQTNDTTDFKNAMRIDLLNGEIVESFKEPRAEWNGVSDPHGELVIKQNQVFLNGKVIKDNFSPLVVLRGRPWIVTRSKDHLEFCERENLASQVSVEVPQQVQDFVKDNSKHIQSTKTFAEEDSARDRLVVFFPDRQRDDGNAASLWVLPLADAKLPQKPMLMAGIKFPDLIEPGTPIKLPLASSDQQSKVSLRKAPDGMAVEGNFLTWNPTKAQLGQHNVDLDISVGNETASRSYQVTVGFPSIKLGFQAYRLAISENGKTLVAGNMKNLAIIDTESRKILSKQALEHEILDVVVNSHSVYVLSSDKKVIEYPLADLTKPVTRSDSANGNALYIAKDRLLFFLQDRREPSKSIRFTSVKQLPEFSDTLKTKLMSEVTGYNPNTVSMADNGELSAGSILLDERGEKVVSMHSLKWSKIFGLGRAMDSIGVAGSWMPTLQSSPQMDDSCTLNHSPNCSIKFELQPDKSPQKTLMYMSIRNGDIDMPRFQYTAFQGRSTSPLAVGSANVAALMVNDQVVIIPTDNLGIAPPKTDNVAPLVLRSKEIIDTIAVTGKENVSFIARGGKPPYAFQLNAKTMLDNVLGSQQNSSQLIQCNPKNGVVNIDAKNLALVLITKENRWIFDLVQSQKNQDKKQYQPSEAIAAYRNSVLENLAPVAKGKIKGVPISLQLNLLVTDSENRKVELSHEVVLDIPMAQFVKAMDKNF